MKYKTANTFEDILTGAVKEIKEIEDFDPYDDIYKSFSGKYINLLTHPSEAYIFSRKRKNYYNSEDHII